MADPRNLPCSIHPWQHPQALVHFNDFSKFPFALLRSSDFLYDDARLVPQPPSAFDRESYYFLPLQSLLESSPTMSGQYH